MTDVYESDTSYDQVDRCELFKRTPDWLSWDDIPDGTVFYTRFGLAYLKKDRGCAQESFDWQEVDEDDADESDAFDDFPYFAVAP